ncbi:hypothetical protein CBR71_18995 [Bordetella hinzii]|nr:hypothetical protein CBR70_18740 [Bordetella hinzii]QDJ47750.1 hypothetical protein CBR71_18995 [Bordetella hinzii]QDJ56661.1 hypothetical protein CBR72_18415 [Bordetella hinzii]
MAQHDVDAVVGAGPLERGGHARAHRQALAQRAAGGFDHGAQALGCIDLQRRAVVAIAVQARGVEVAARGQGGVEDGGVVRRREDEAVAAGPIGLLRALAQLGEIQRGEQVGRAQALLHIALAGAGHHAHDLLAQGAREGLYARPRHPYTQALLKAVPRPEVGRHREPPIKGELLSVLNRPAGCSLSPRCPHATERCREEKPLLREVETGWMVACHHHETIDARG